MTNTKQDKINVIFNKMNDESLWDDMYVDIAEDEDGDTYVICDSHEDMAKFIGVVKDALNINNEEFDSDYDVEIETGMIMVFSDEYTTCSDCGNVIRTSPDSYHWQPDFYVGDGFIACNTCFNDTEDYQDAYIEEHINDPSRAINGIMTEEQIEERGFTKLDADYQSGWYNRNDDPKQIYDALSDRFAEVLFFIDGVGQFHVDFGVFVRGEYDETL